MRKAEIIGLTGHDESPARALEVGKAAEHLVCAELILQGHRAFLSDQFPFADALEEVLCRA